MSDSTFPVKEGRLLFLDNLRTFLILLVVVNHAGWVYERSGLLSSLWIVNDPAKNDLAGILNLIIDMFLMPTMFFISGYFTPLSVKTRTAWSFVKSRLKRLMLPWIIAVLTLIPLYKVIFLYSRNLPQDNLLSYFHFSGDILINQGWLWFLPVLFLFDMLYLLLTRVNPVKIKFGLKTAVASIFVLGFIFSFCMSYFGLYGWTKTFLLDFQNERLLIYFLMFLLGALSYKQNVFDVKPASKTLYYILAGTIWIPMNVYIIFLVNIFLNPGHFIFSKIVDLALIWSGFHLSLLGLLYIMVSTFRYYLNKGGVVIKRINSNSYGVYIIHFIVVGIVALVLLDTGLSSLAKYGSLIVLSYAISNLIVYLYKVLIIRAKNSIPNPA